jgi:uncharacterized caspase-like protein
MLRAVVIGIDKYTDPKIPNLRYAKKDAEAVYELLLSGIFPSDRSVALLTDESATKRNLMVAIGEELVRTTSHLDTVVIYFAGHGSPETVVGSDEASRYLVLHDSEYENIYATGIDMERDLSRWFTRLRDPNLIVMFLDCCFSGRAGGRTFEGPHLHRVRTRYRGPSPVKLRNFDWGQGRLIMTACDDDQVACEDDRLEHGIFTHHLLAKLQADEGCDPAIGIGELYEGVCKAVRGATGDRQIPIINGRGRAPSLPRLPRVDVR